MIFENSQDTFVLDEKVIPQGVTKVGIKLSGGADSAIVCYMLAKYIKEERPEVTLFPITCVAEGKAYQEIFAKKVVNKIEELLDFKFGTHYVTHVRADNSENYTGDQDAFVFGLYDKKLLEQHFAGINAMPNKEDAPELYDFPDDMLPSDDRSKQIPKRAHRNGSSTRPLINIDKKGVAEHYNRLGVMDELFPMTRSCEEYTEDFSNHCGWCWFCLERKWGFGKL